MASPRIFFTTDWHLGDPRLDILSRPFGTVQEMHERIIAEHNRMVAPHDTVYVLGDALHRDGGAPVDILGRFNGNLVLLRGNHDVLDDDYAPYVQEVIPEGEGVELDVEGVPCWLVHYPTLGREDRFNLTGHIHNRWLCAPTRNGLNCGVDVHRFRPLSAERVAFYYRAVCEFNDDVWLPGLPARTDRGRPGSYFQRS